MKGWEKCLLNHQVMSSKQMGQHRQMTVFRKWHVWHEENQDGRDWQNAGYAILKIQKLVGTALTDNQVPSVYTLIDSDTQTEFYPITETSNQWRTWRRVYVRRRSNFQVLVMSRAAAFITHWSFLVTDFSAAGSLSRWSNDGGLSFTIFNLLHGPIFPQLLHMTGSSNDSLLSDSAHISSYITEVRQITREGERYSMLYKTKD